MNVAVGTGLLVASATSWFHPGFNGLIFSETPMTPAEGHIMASVFLVGALLAFLMPKKSID